MARKDKTTNTDSTNEAALDDALKQIEKKFGKGSIMKLGEQENNCNTSGIAKAFVMLRNLLTSSGE